MTDHVGPSDPSPAVSATVAPTPRPSDARTLATAALVLEITTAAAGERELGAILDAALDGLRGVVSFTGGSIALVEGDDLVIRAAIGPLEATAMGQRLARGPSRSWRVVDERRPVRIDDLAALGLTATSDTGRTGAIRSWMAVPIVRRGTAIGLLEVDSTEPGAFHPEDERLVATIGLALAGPVDLAARYVAEQRAREVRDAFVGVVGHELRTPITTIYGMSRVLRERHRDMDPETRAQAIADIEAESDRLRRLAEDLLVLSRAEAGRLALAADPLLVTHIVRRVAEEEAARWPGHDFAVDAPAGLPLVVGEELHVGQVVQNLLSNAAKYSPSGTTVRTTVQAEDDGITVRVLDEGPGLPEGPPDRLFELYYRAPDAIGRSPGAGIGLFVCRQLVEAMGGRIWAAPRAERGSEFGFWLPALVEVDGADV